MDTTAHSPQFTASTFDENHHICAFFYSIDEQHRVLRPFIKDGFDRGDKAFHLVDPDRREEHLRRLAEAGIDVQEATGLNIQGSNANNWALTAGLTLSF